MKKFMKDLEKELKRLMINEQDIEEILADHAEMIEAALSEGVSEEELNKKFGDPAVLAKQLKETSPVVNNVEYDENVQTKRIGNDYKLFKSFPVMEDSYAMMIKLVSEDVVIKKHEGESIEIYHKGRIDKYEASYENNEFTLKKKKKVTMFEFGKSTKFQIYLPAGKDVTTMKYVTTSGDAEIYDLKSDSSEFNAVSGDFELTNYFTGPLSVQTVSGDCEIKGGKSTETSFQSISGDFELLDFSVDGSLRLKTVSGDFEFRNVEAGETQFKSVSGDCDGVEFYPTSISLNSVSGDVEIENKDTAREIVINKTKSVSGDIVINGAKH